MTDLTKPEQHLGPYPKVCCEHWVGQGEDGWPECCICNQNPCPQVTVNKAIEHSEYEQWRGARRGILLARSVLSDAIAAASPDDRPTDPPDSAHAAAVEAFHACWVIVRGDLDEPPF